MAGMPLPGWRFQMCPVLGYELACVRTARTKKVQLEEHLSQWVLSCSGRTCSDVGHAQGTLVRRLGLAKAMPPEVGLCRGECFSLSGLLSWSALTAYSAQRTAGSISETTLIRIGAPILECNDTLSCRSPSARRTCLTRRTRPGMVEASYLFFLFAHLRRPTRKPVVGQGWTLNAKCFSICSSAFGHTATLPGRPTGLGRCSQSP